MTHGKASTYKNGCRCDECREANTVYQRDYVHRTGRHKPQAEYVREQREKFDTHGREARYKRGCRCEACRVAAAVARRSRRHANREAANAYDREYKARRRAEAKAAA